MTAPVQRTSSNRPPLRVWLAGVLCLLAGVAASALLIFQHFNGGNLPGCGAGSPCARAAASVWGKVPGLGWPVSFVGLAYFLGMYTAWQWGWGRLSRMGFFVARAGAVASVVFLAVALVESMACPYCIAAQVANLCFYGVAARGRRGADALARELPLRLAVAAIVFAATVSALLIADASQRETVRRDAEKSLAESTARLTQQAKPQPSPRPHGESPAAAAPPPAPVPAAGELFTGRYRLGPEASPVRIVMFTDYQCPDCKLLHAQVEKLLAEHAAISVSIKYFPLCIDCNPNAPGKLHANACWAARAAEAAGILAGADGFWKMSRWLFARGGSFTDDELRAGVRELGLGDPAAFERTMTSRDTLDRIKEDVDEGMDLGIYNTPFIFINGVELRGWSAPDALVRAVHALLDTSPPAVTAIADKPPIAAEKMLEDWRRSPVVQIPASVLRHPIGPRDAPVTVVMFGDYAEENTAQADAVIRLFTEGPDANVCYYFAQFPFDQSCNPVVQETRHPDACERAKSAEAAYLLGGDDGFFAIHSYLMRNQGAYTPEGLRVAVVGASIDRGQFEETLAQAFLTQAVTDDCTAAKQLGITSIPLIFINGKNLQRWKAGSENVIARVVYAAAVEQAK